MEVVKAESVCKECGQAPDTFLEENAARMCSVYHDLSGARWIMHPAVRMQLYMWKERSDYIHPGGLVQRFHSPYGRENDTLYGLPIHWDDNAAELGREGDVTLRCAAGEVVLKTRN